MPVQIDSGEGPKKLNKDQLESVDLAEHAFRAVLDYLRRPGGDERDAKVRALPRQWRAVYTVLVLDFEIGNGGHHQFFWNTEGALNNETLEDLNYIGAEPFIPIFQDALTVYATCNYEQEKYSPGGFEQGERDKRFEECDKRFCAEQKMLSEYVGDYIRRTPSLHS